MTSNQLELRSIKTREAANSITKSYNEGMVDIGNRNAAENIRHNQANEDIANAANQITKDYNTWFQNWQDDYTRWERNYKDNALKLQYANESQKRELERDQLRLSELMTNANVEKAQADADYTRQMGVINAKAQDLKEQAQDWKEQIEWWTHNWNMTMDTANYQLDSSYRYINSLLKWNELNIENEGLKISQMDAETRRMNAETERWRVEDQAYLIYTGQVPNLQADTTYLNSRTDLTDSEKFRNYATAITSALGSVADAFGNFQKTMEGVLNGNKNPIGFSNY